MHMYVASISARNTGTWGFFGTPFSVAFHRRIFVKPTGNDCSVPQVDISAKNLTLTYSPNFSFNRLSTLTPEPRKESARRWIRSSRERRQGATPLHTRGLYSMTGRTKPLYVVSRPGMSRTADALSKKPIYWAASKCWPKFKGLSKVTPRSLSELASSTVTASKFMGVIGHGWRCRKIAVGTLMAQILQARWNPFRTVHPLRTETLYTWLEHHEWMA